LGPGVKVLLGIFLTGAKQNHKRLRPDYGSEAFLGFQYWLGSGRFPHHAIGLGMKDHGDRFIASAGTDDNIGPITVELGLGAVPARSLRGITGLGLGPQ
jgi:hypothetical protein